MRECENTHTWTESDQLKFIKPSYIPLFCAFSKFCIRKSSPEKSHVATNTPFQNVSERGFGRSIASELNFNANSFTMHASLHACSANTHQHMHPPTHLVCPHQQLLAPYLTQVLDNLHVSSTTGYHEAGPAILHTLAVRSPACAVSSTPSTRSALLLSL
jgi:hypothetical protein